MHNIATVDTERQAELIADLLRKEGIRYAFELRRSERGDRFDVLVLNLEDVKKAKRIISSYEPGPSDGKDRSTVQNDPIVPKSTLVKAKRKRQRRPRPISWLITFVCVSLFLVHEVERREIVASERGANVDLIVITPLMRSMIIDFPAAFEYVVDFQRGLPQKPNPALRGITETQSKLLDGMGKTPFWGGIYSLAVAKMSGKDPTIHNGKLFERLRRGEIWRLVTPVFLHESLLHLFFNMFWLLTVGSLIEQRISSGRFLLLISILSVVTDVAQYIVSGPLFLGFSGVACGFVGFIFARRQIAPWENYRVEPAIFWLFFGYVGVIAFLQCIMFTMALLSIPTWPMHIANTAHIIGALAGYALGCLPQFSWRVQR